MYLTNFTQADARRPLGKSCRVTRLVQLMACFTTQVRVFDPIVGEERPLSPAISLRAAATPFCRE